MQVTGWFTDFARKLFDIRIDENSFVVREKLEDVVLHILAIFRSVVNRHDEFLRLLLQHDKNAIVRGLDEIITASMNARTTRRDFIFVFLRYNF